MCAYHKQKKIFASKTEGSQYLFLDKYFRTTFFSKNAQIVTCDFLTKLSETEKKIAKAE